MLSSGLRFLRDTTANVAVVFAITLLPITAGIGGAVDVTRSVTIGSEIQSALDSGTLAAASLTQTADPESVVRAYIEGAIEEYGGVIESLVVTVNADVALNSREVVAEAVVRVPTLLLGVAGIQEITMGKTSTALEQVQNVEVALVLDISSSMRGNKIDSLREASIDFIDSVLGRSGEELTSISIIPYGGTVQLDPSFHRYLDPASGISAADWNGCLELPADHVDRVVLDEGGYAPFPEFTVWNRGNNWCPPDEDGTSALFLTSNRDDLAGLLSTFDNPILSDGTGTDIATGWGVRALDPAWRGKLGGHFPDRPADYTDERTLKVMVVMTDGGITQQRRPEPPWEEGVDDPHVGTGGTYDFYNKSTATSNFEDACELAKDNGVVVYTIAFQVSGSSNRQLMENCATKPDQYYDVQSLDIAAAFSSIASDLNRLRLTR